MKYSKHFSTKKTRQSQPIPGENQVKNNAGGYVYKIDKWGMLDRFLILGSSGNTFYCKEKKMTVDNAENVLKCIKEDSKRTVDRIIEISESGRAPKNDPAIFALALAASKSPSPEENNYALKNLSKVCRIGTHLFSFVETIKGLRGFGVSVRRALSDWYLSKDLSGLSYQLTKYQSRDGWSHRDVLRLCHAKPNSPTQERMLGWATGKTLEVNGNDARHLPYLYGIESVKKCETAQQVVKLIEEYKLVQEQIPTKWHTDNSVMEALLAHMPFEATLRSLGKITANGLLTTFSPSEKVVINRLSNKELLKKARIHPLNVLKALYTYSQGHGLKGSKTWTTNQRIVDALDDCFYSAFEFVEPAGKNFMLGLDVSGSMGCGQVGGSPMTPLQAEGAMAMVTLRTEPNCYLKGFSHKLVDVPLSKKDRLDTVIKKMTDIPMGGTDCALPMVHALQAKIPVDIFVVSTDSETWYGNIHPKQALDDYRQGMGRDAKLVVIGFTATDFSIADSSKPYMLDVVGFDSAAPSLVSSFARGDF